MNERNASKREQLRGRERNKRVAILEERGDVWVVLNHFHQQKGTPKHKDSCQATEHDEKIHTDHFHVCEQITHKPAHTRTCTQRDNHKGVSNPRHL